MVYQTARQNRTHWVVALACCFLLAPLRTNAQAIRVRFKEGATHGFLALKNLDGQTIASGDSMNVVRDKHVDSELVFHFKDGSLYDDKTVFTENGVFKLLSDHLIEKGPSFKDPIETWLNGITGEYKARYWTKKGNQKPVSKKLKLPKNIANGMIYILLDNVAEKDRRTTLSLLTASRSPRMVELIITPRGEDSFVIGGAKRKAIDYKIHFHIQGLAGLVAPIIGKQPPDMNIWVLKSPVPTFVREQGILYEGGPIWRIELTSPRLSTAKRQQAGRQKSQRKQQQRRTGP